MTAPVQLATHTSLRLGGPAPAMFRAKTCDEVCELVGRLDRDGSPVLILGGGSNLVIADDGISYPVVKIDIPGVRIEPSTHRSALVTVGAGVLLDDMVAELTAAGYGELAPLSGIPGTVGATPIQNVGAYGTDIANSLASLELYDRQSKCLRTAQPAELQLGYRTSNLRGTDRAVICQVSFQVTKAPTVIGYAELARTLGVKPGSAVPPEQVRSAVIDLRRSKGMVLDPRDADTVSAGSFFTNPIVDHDQLAVVQARLPEGMTMPQYPVGPGHTKLSAAFLMDKAGFGRSFALDPTKAAVSSKHCLALTNRGGSTADLLALAKAIQDGVYVAFGVRLAPEPVLVGVSLA